MTRTSALSRRSLLTRTAACVVGGFVGGPIVMAQSALDTQIWSKEYWAKKDGLSLYLFRKRMGDPATDRTPRPVLFLAHGRVVLEGDPKTLPSQHGAASLDDLFVQVAHEALLPEHAP